jgi:carotenoid cleavage dioxygenase
MGSPAPLSGVFAPQRHEIDADRLPVDGELPAEINGDYLRNGPNPRFGPLGLAQAVLDGDAMLHRVSFRDGRASYANRFVRTPALRAEEAAGRALWPGWAGPGWAGPSWAGPGRAPGAELVGPELAHTAKDRPSVSVIRHAGRLLALAESASPFAMSPELATLGRETFGGLLPAGITGHPRIDPATGEMVVVSAGPSEPQLTWSVIGADGWPARIQTPVDGVTRPVLIHDVALTPAYLVLIIGPPSSQAGRGTRIGLIPRSGGPVRWLASPAFWLGHAANAYEQTSPRGSPEVVLDYVRVPAPAGTAGTRGVLSRLRLDLTAGRVAHQRLAEAQVDFPRIDDRSLTRPHRFIATTLASGRFPLPAGDADTLAWFDTRTDRLATWPAGTLAVGEQTFVPRPGDPDPARGWWLSFATDRTDLTSRLLVLPAGDPAAGPVAAVRLPQRVPLGQHGTWLPAAS